MTVAKFPNLETFVVSRTIRRKKSRFFDFMLVRNFFLFMFIQDNAFGAGFRHFDYTTKVLEARGDINGNLFF